MGGGVIFKVRSTRDHFGAKVAGKYKEVDISRLDPNLKVIISQCDKVPIS